MGITSFTQVCNKEHILIEGGLMQKYTVEQLQAVAKEINNLEFGFDPPLNCTLTSVRALIDEITPNALHLQADDPLSDTTKKVLCDLGVGPWLSNQPDDGEAIDDQVGGNDLDENIDEDEAKEKELVDVVDAIVGQEIKTQREALPVGNENKDQSAKGVVNATPKAQNTPKQPNTSKKEGVKKPAEPKKPVALSRYGHRVGSMAAVLDDLLWKGVEQSVAVATLAKDFKKTEKLALGKFKGHVAYLPKVRGVQVSVKDGVYKTQRATLPEKV